MSIADADLTEDQVIQKVYDLLQEKEITLSRTIPLTITIPTTTYLLSGQALEAFFKLSSGSIANMVIFLEAAYRKHLVRDKSGISKPVGEILTQLIKDQIELPEKLKNQSNVFHRERREYLIEATRILSQIKSSLPR